MIEPPKPLSGTVPLAVWLNQLLRSVVSLRPLESPTAKPEHGAKGFTMNVKPGSGAGGTSTLNYRGTYSATETYAKGDIVRVMTGNSQGVWISVSAASMTNVPPVFPEPASTVTVPPSVNKWELFALGIQMTNVCQNGNKVVFINATAPA